MEYLSPKDGGLLSPKRLRSELALLSLFIFSTMGIFLYCSYAEASASPIVRVMVEREKQLIRIDGFDLVLFEGLTNRRLAREDRRAEIPIRCTLGGRMEITVGANTKRPEKLRVSGPLRIQSLGGFIRVQERQYRDDLYIYSFNGDCIVVNHVDLEKYIAGLLNSEMSANWNSQALMAQAVAARTYAMYQMNEVSGARFRSLKPPFDLDSSVKDQVYEGAHQERYKALRAVQETRGQILSYQGKPIKAFYHSTCGGRTEKAEVVWGGRYPYMRSVECGFCNNSPRFNWVYNVNTTEFEARLRKEGLLHGALLAINVIDRNRIGRANNIQIQGTGGRTIASGIKLRNLMGSVNVRSTDFSVVSEAGKVTFIGHGSGHGVGMCQYGAKSMADRGRNYSQILKHYYPAAEITKIY